MFRDIDYMRYWWRRHVRFLDRALPAGWRDKIVFLLQWIFIIAMGFSIVGNNKPDFYTALPTAATVTAFAYIYATLRWWWTVVATSTLALEWWIITYQVA